MEYEMKSEFNGESHSQNIKYECRWKEVEVKYWKCSWANENDQWIL